MIRRGVARSRGARGLVLAAATGLTAVLAACSGAPAHGPSASDAAATSPAFTVVRMTSSAAQPELLVRPKGPVRGLVVFMHGLDSDENQIVSAPQLEAIGGVLVKAGYAIVSSYAHGDNLGNPASVRDQRLAVADARHRLGTVHQVDILAFSMGGLDALLTAASHRIAGLHALALLSPAVDQRAFAKGRFAGQVDAAFGDPKPSQVAGILRRSDPLLQPAHRYVGYRYHFWHSPDDRTVPVSQSVSMAGYLAGAGIHAPVTPLTGDHGDLAALDPADVLRLFAGSTA